MAIKPWKKVGPPETLAQSNGRGLTLQKYRDPNTNKTSDYAICVAESCSIALAITDANQVLTVKQFRQGLDGITLELPAGRQKYVEQSPESVAREEIAEETMGYEPEKVTALIEGGLTLEPAYTKFWIFPFLFTGCRKTNLKARPDQGEYIEVVEIPLPKWVQMCFDGQILDPKSMVTTMLALKHLEYTLRPPFGTPIF